MKIKYLFCSIALYFVMDAINAQQVPTGPTISPASTPPVLEQHAWYRGGNFAGGLGGVKNLFGTMWNSPIYTLTDAIHRTRVNGTFTAGGATMQPAINGVNFPVINTSGYFGIAPNGYFATNTPASMLHLQGPDNSGFGSLAGWRAWMKTGTFTSENSDALYVGMKQEAGTNRSDAVVAWSDDSGAGGFGADKLRFIFTNPAVNPTSLNPLTPLSLPGYEFMRMVSSPTQTNSTGAPVGNVGIGPVFTDPLPPQNRLHINGEEQLAVFMQISNQNPTLGTGQTANDGLHVGYAPTALNNKEAIVNQKENDRLTMYSNNGERVRITQIGGLNNGVAFNPGALPTNLTRVAISEDPLNPITRPLSLLHIGYNVQNAISNDGWRAWMDVGMFASKSSDNVYLGLKAEPGILGIPGFDRQDAVLNWGDNQISSGLPTNGPDNLRFIFTSSTTASAGGSPVAVSANGLETGRFYPGRDTLGTYGRFGVGDFTASGVNQNPTHKIDVVGNGRFRFLPDTIYRKDSLVEKIVFVDSLGVLRWEYADSLSISGIGNYCSATSNPLTGHFEVPLSDYNYYFSGQGMPTKSKVAIGVPCSTFIPFTKFYVKQLVPYNGLSIAGQFDNNTTIGSQNYGIQTYATGGVSGFGIYAQASGNSSVNYGVYSAASTSIAANRAGYFAGKLETTAASVITSDQMFKTDVDGIKSASEILRKLKPHTYKMDVINFPQFNFDVVQQYGFIAQEVEQVLPELVTEAKSADVLDSLGNVITPSITYKSLNYNALIPITVQAVNELGARYDKSTLSDQTIKTNVQNLSGSLAKVKQMRGVTYEWSASAQNDMYLDSIQHIGFIAQEIAAIDPLLTFVDDSSLMHVNYDRVVPMLVESIKDLDAQIQTKDSIIAYKDSILDYRMTVLESALNACCNSHSMQQNNNSNNSIAQQDVNLKDGQTIILDQNSPNPFSEQTTINYFLPDNVVKAQMLFYNVSGKLIQSVDLNEKGKGSLNVFAQDLSNGIYTYTLVVDGKIIETKKMVKQQ